MPNRFKFSFIFAVTAAIPFTSVIAQSGASTSSGGNGQSRTPSSAVVGGDVQVSQRLPIPVPAGPAGEMRPLLTQQISAAPAVRIGEHNSAPWLQRAADPATRGRILRSTDLPGVAMRVEERSHFLINEKLYVVPPSGAMAFVGQRFVAASEKGIAGTDSYVVMPAGIVTIEAAGPSGEASVARITHQFAQITPQSVLIPYEAMAAQRTGVPTAVPSGPEARVVWVGLATVLPSIQSWIILDAGAGTGVRAGDVYTLLRPRQQSADGIWIPEQEIAKARVVRVSELGSTLVIMSQVQPSIQPGVMARLTARM